MLSSTSRMLTYLTAALALLTGLPLFIMPEQMAPVFAWRVTPLVVMTIGAWCLGNAWLAFWVARHWDWTTIRTSIIYLWLFGVLESAVVIAFLDKLVLAHWTAWLYVIMLTVNLLAALWGIADWLRLRPITRPAQHHLKGTHAGLTAFFLVFVGFLGLYGMFAPVGSLGTNGGIFPDVLSAFTQRAFAAFYLSLSLCALSLWRSRSLEEGMFHGLAAYGLLVTISAAIVAYWPLFDIAAAPGRLIYVGSYALVSVIVAYHMIANRRVLKEVLGVRPLPAAATD